VDSLLSAQLISEVLLNESSWSESQGAAGEFLGSRLLYYTLAYMTKAQLCVCIGTGGGYVPRMMRQAQRDLRVVGETLIIDANRPEAGWGAPMWLDPVHSCGRCIQRL
jgi:hypothetical protein